MERERSKMPPAERVEEEDMYTAGHGDKLQDSVDKVTEAGDDEDGEKTTPKGKEERQESPRRA